MRERDLTDAVAAIAAADMKFRIRLAGYLLKTAAMRDDRPAERAAALRRHLPRKQIEFHNQHHSSNDLGVLLSLRELFGTRRNMWNFVDWVWETPDFILAVEVKTSRKTLFQPEQLERYTKAAKRARKPYYGVLVLTPERPSAQVLRRVDRRKGFVGAVLWREAGPLLRTLKPADAEHAARWTDLLESVAPST